jgi:hypothetical protein
MRRGRLSGSRYLGGDAILVQHVAGQGYKGAGLQDVAVSIYDAKRTFTWDVKWIF